MAESTVDWIGVRIRTGRRLFHHVQYTHSMLGRTPLALIGLVRLSYNPYFLACFFSQNSVFLLLQISRNSISFCFFSEVNGTNGLLLVSITAHWGIYKDWKFGTDLLWHHFGPRNRKGLRLHGFLSISFPLASSRFGPAAQH